MAGTAQQAEFCQDRSLGYLRSRTLIVPGKGLVLDESYRLAHLPLVNPAHADVVRSAAGKDYLNGVHQRVHSLVVPLSDSALQQSAAFRELEKSVRAASFAPKIAWDIAELRRHKLHATICGGLGQGDVPPVLGANVVRALAGTGPIRVRISGLFSGNVNIGRLYLMAYPELRDGANMFQHIQGLMGRKVTDLYVVGLYNLTDHLSPEEASELDRVISDWWGRTLLEIDVRELWLVSATDDLVIDSRIEAKIPLCMP